MKKLLLLALSTSLFACSGDDSSETTNNPESLNPPLWLQGEWGIITGTGTSQKLFRFTSNNVCQLTGASQLCLVEHVNNSNEHNVSASLSEESSDVKYYVTLTFEAGSIQHYNFEKISNTEIKWVNAMIPGASQLTKLN